MVAFCYLFGTLTFSQAGIQHIQVGLNPSQQSVARDQNSPKRFKRIKSLWTPCESKIWIYIYMCVCVCKSKKVILVIPVIPASARVWPQAFHNCSQLSRLHRSLLHKLKDCITFKHAMDSLLTSQGPQRSRCLVFYGFLKQKWYNNLRPNAEKRTCQNAPKHSFWDTFHKLNEEKGIWCEDTTLAYEFVAATQRYSLVNARKTIV